MMMDAMELFPPECIVNYWLYRNEGEMTQKDPHIQKSKEEARQAERQPWTGRILIVSTVLALVLLAVAWIFNAG